MYKAVARFLAKHPDLIGPGGKKRKGPKISKGARKRMKRNAEQLHEVMDEAARQVPSLEGARRSLSALAAVSRAKRPKKS